MKQNSLIIITLEPEDGYILTNGETYSKKVYLGPYDSPENWHEIPEEQVPNEYNV